MGGKKLNIFLRKHKYIVFILQIAIGIIINFIAFDCCQMTSCIYDVLIGVGSGIIGTATVSIILLYTCLDDTSSGTVNLENIENDVALNLYLSQLCCEENEGNFVSPDITYESIDQICAINKLLKMLCKEEETIKIKEEMHINDSSDGSVHGVVATFKSNKRRTIASFKGSRKEEKNKVHNRTDGVVGKMLEINKNSSSSKYTSVMTFFNSNSNKESAFYTVSTSDRVKSEVKNKPIKWESCSSETAALLAVPIFSRKDDKTIIATLTLDFSRGETSFANVKSAYVKALAEKAGLYASVIRDILGFFPKKEYRDLMLDNWGNTNEWE